MKKQILHIRIAYLYHAVYIVLAFMLMGDYVDGLLAFFAVGGILYLGYWIVANAKGYMPWIVYKHFLIGAAIEVILNVFGIIPRDGPMFSGLGQAIYVIIVVLYAALIGIVNLILWLIDKKRNKA